MALGFQRRCVAWARHCFGLAVVEDRTERTHRFLEEALELAQACNCTKEEALQLVVYVYGRPTGVIFQEVGGVLNTLAILCAIHGLDMDRCGETELDRVWEKVDKIRAKHAAKPKFGPLPGQVDITPEMERDLEKRVEAAIRGWFIDHNLRMTAWSFADTRNEEHVEPSPEIVRQHEQMLARFAAKEEA